MINIKSLLIISIINIFFLNTKINALEAGYSKEVQEKVCKRYREESGILDDSDKIEFDADEFEDTKDLIKSMIEGRTYLRDRIIDEKTTDEEFFESLLMDILPWLIFLVLSLIGFITYVCCYCCDMLCPKIICCKRKDNYSKFQLAWPIVGLLIFAVWVIFSGSFGAYKGTYFTEGYFMMKCKAVQFLDDFNSGNKEDDNSIWKGLVDLEVSMNNIKENYIQEVDLAFPLDSAWMEDDYQDLKTKSELLWAPNNGNKYTWTNLPYTEDTSPSNDSRFYNENWKAYTDIFTNIVVGSNGNQGAILEMKISMQDTNTQGQEVAGDSFENSINDGIKSINDLVKSVNQAVFDIEDLTKDVDDDVMPEVEKYVIVYFCISIFAAVLGIFSVVMVVPLKIHKLRVLMHCSWCIFSIWMIAGFAISTCLYAVSVLGFQGCDIMDKILNDFEELKSVGVIKGEILDYIQTCKAEYGGKGDILVKLGVDQQLDDMRILNSKLGETIELNEQKTADFDQIKAQIILAQTDIQLMIDSGKFIKQNAEELEYILNSQQLEAGYCNGSDDILSISDSPACNVWPTIGNIVSGCYRIHTIPDANSRTKCVNSAGNADFLDTVNWIVEKNGVANNSKTDLDSFGIATNLYLDQTDEWIAGLKTFDQNVESILDDVDAIVEKESNCLFLGQNLNDINEALCGDFIPDIYFITINLIVHSFGMFLGSFFLYCAGFRYAQINRQKKYEEKSGPYERTNEPIPN